MGKCHVNIAASNFVFLSVPTCVSNALKCYLFICHLRWGPAADVNVAIRKIATLLKPDKDISHDGDHIIIKTLSTFKNYNMDFYVGKEFEEDLSGVDDRKCMVSIWTNV